MPALMQDARYALRGLRTNPWLAIAAISTLAMGLGATTAVYTLVHALLLSALPVAAPEELVRVGPGTFQWPAFTAFRQHPEIFSSVLASSGVRRLEVQTGTGSRQPIDVSLVSGSFFSTLGVRAALGRTFTEDD